MQQKREWLEVLLVVAWLRFNPSPGVGEKRSRLSVFEVDHMKAVVDVRVVGS